MNSLVCTPNYVSTVAVKRDEGEEDRNFWMMRKRQNSNPYSFTSGHESDHTPPDSPRPSTAFALPDKSQKSEDERGSAKPSKRSRKLSLFSFSFTSKSDERMTRFWRGISQTSPFTQSELRSAKLKSVGEDSLNSTAQKCPQLTLPACSRVELENKVLQEILQDTLKQQFDSVLEYKRDVCDRLAKNVSQLVKRRVEVFKESASRGFKVVSLVYVGAVKEEGIAVASQALLESDTDNFTVASYRNGHLFAVAGVMAIPIQRNGSKIA